MTASSTNAPISIMHLPKPTIAAISGFCIGGGSGLALANDFRFAAPAAVFAITAAKLSIVYGIRETQNLLAAVGLTNAKKSSIRPSASIPPRLSASASSTASPRPVAAAHGFAADLAKNAPLSISGAKMICKASRWAPACSISTRPARWPSAR